MTRQKKTNSDLANMAQSTIKGRASGAGTGAPVDLTAAEVLTIIGGSIIYQRNLAAALSLADGECLVAAGYVNAAFYSITLLGDARLEIL